MYYISATNTFGCSGLLPVTVTFSLPQLNIVNPAPVTFPSTVDLSSCFPAQADVSYGYYMDPQATIPVQNYTAVSVSATYYIKAETPAGCVNIRPVKVVILPPEPFSITTPNTFTPNNDGVNDYFAITINGYVTFDRLDIYNRNGSLMFSTHDIAARWDGTFNGRPVPIGTYYWVFEGYDTYYHRKINRSSYIALIR